MQYKNEDDQRYYATIIETPEEFSQLVSGKKVVLLHRRQGAMPGEVVAGKFQAKGNPIFPNPNGERLLIPEECLGYVQLDKENLRTGYDIRTHTLLGFVAVVY